jgi:hypothetical protein
MISCKSDALNIKQMITITAITLSGTYCSYNYKPKLKLFHHSLIHGEIL